ncbi:MAG: dihydroorotate dehydrogenase electron transfer subunit [Desulfurivibrio sp.]
MTGQFAAEVSKKEKISDDIFRLTLIAPEIAATARPGQFVMLRSGAMLDPLLSRPFSIHQCMADGRIQVLFKVFGEGTRRLAALEKGEVAGLVGPLGRGFSLLGEGRVCLVGGGMGIAPLFFLARELLRRADPPQDIVLLLGARTANDLGQLAREFEVMGLRPRLATDDGTLGHGGLVPELLPRYLTEGKYRIYCCGPTPMMAAVAAYAIEREWPCQVSMETMMACGISACLGCAVKTTTKTDGYQHVCKNGPVFAAEDIAWNR